jgi:hypothetical protein
MHPSPGWCVNWQLVLAVARFDAMLSSVVIADKVIFSSTFV